MKRRMVFAFSLKKEKAAHLVRDRRPRCGVLSLF